MDMMDMMDRVDDLDELLNTAVLEAVLDEGRSTTLAARQFGAARVIASATRVAGRPASTWANTWTAADEAFLAEHAGHLGDEELAEALGRSAVSIRVRRRRRGYPGPTVHPDYVTAQGIAKSLGIDVHAVCGWIERGLMAAELAPLADRKIWRVRRVAFYAWALNPLNWVYFIRPVRDPERIRDEKLRRLIARRAEQWGDEWWSIGEVADYHGVDAGDVNRAIRAGRLPATDWGNWWVLRSEATRPGLRFYKGKGAVAFDRHGTPGGDAFVVLATAVGIPATHIARMMGAGRSHSYATVRYQGLVKRGLVPWLVRAYELPVERRELPGRGQDGQDGQDGQGRAVYWADWRKVVHRFPMLARAWGKVGREERLTGPEKALVTGVLRSFLAFHYPGHPLRKRVHSQGQASAGALREAWELYEASRNDPGGDG